MAQKFVSLPTTETNIITAPFRLSYPHVWEPTVNELRADKRKEFSITMLFDKKTSKTDLAPLYALMQKVATHRFGANPKGLLNPFKDGDTHTTKAGELVKEKTPSYEGQIVLRSWSTTKPGIVNGKKETIIDHDEVYGGCYCRAQLNCYAYDFAGNKGIAFGLLNLQKVKDGEPFGSRVKAEDAFSPVESAGGESLAEETSGGMFN